MRRRVATAIVLALTAGGVALTAAPAQAATLCVNPGGTGGCFATIQGAINAAAPSGDSIQIASGTYNESKVLVNKSLTIQGAGPGQTILDGQNVAPTGSGLLEVQTTLDFGCLIACPEGGDPDITTYRSPQLCSEPRQVVLGGSSLLSQERVKCLLASALVLGDVSEEDRTKLALELVGIVGCRVKVAHSLDEHLWQVFDQDGSRVVV